MRVLLMAFAVFGLTVRCCGPCATPCIPGVWPRAEVPAEQGGRFLLANGDAVQFSVDGSQHRIELQRAGETLDVVSVPASASLHVCMGAAFREDDSTEHIAVAEEASAVRYAWKVDVSSRKLVAADPVGVRCQDAE